MRAGLAVERALEAGDVLAARQALGDPPEWPNVVDPYLGDTVLALAIARAPAEAITQLLAQGAGLNDGTALHFACWYDDPVAVRILLDAGANPDTRTRIDDYESPREIAERAGGEAQRALAEWLDAHR